MCAHNWIFVAPRHIRCTKCNTTGRRNAARGEREEFNRGNWIYLRAGRTA